MLFFAAVEGVADVAQKEKPPQPILISPDEWRLIQRYFGLARDITERYARASEDSLATSDVFRAFEVRFKKRLDEVLERIERIERLLTLERPAGVEQAAEAREIKSEIRQELGSVEWQLSRRINNLNYLEGQAASYGSMVPLWLINQITDEQTEIQRLQKKRDEKLKT